MIDLLVLNTQPYYGFVEVELNLSHETSTKSSWNWRSLKSLTLNQLSACLYNWDECLFNKKVESSVSWPLSEVADLGYGPRTDSLAYIWSTQSVAKDFDITYSKYFDGARGKNSVVDNIAIYRNCKENDNWLSDDGLHVCYNGTVYKCFYGVSADEKFYGMVYGASIGDTINTGNGNGYVCMNTTTNEKKWKKVSCFN